MGYVSLTKLIERLCLINHDQVSILHVWTYSFLYCDRRAIRRNESVKYVVQDSVLDYIIENKLYNPSYSPGETDSR